MVDIRFPELLTVRSTAKTTHPEVPGPKPLYRVVYIHSELLCRSRLLLINLPGYAAEVGRSEFLVQKKEPNDGFLNFYTDKVKLYSPYLLQMHHVRSYSAHYCRELKVLDVELLAGFANQLRDLRIVNVRDARE